MKITFHEMVQWPDRDAGWYYAADVFDAHGVRYPIRTMIEGIALARFKMTVAEPHDEIVKELYRDELKALLEQEKLAPENTASSVNIVFFADGVDTPQKKPGDILIWNTYEKLLDATRRLGRNV